jgi:hypothetical protein
MRYDAETLEEYLAQLPEDRKYPVMKLRDVVASNIPEGFKERYSDSFIQFIVPHEIYPAGYHVNPKEPLPFIGIASQKHFIGFYHLGIYAFEDISKWFVTEYPKYVSTRLDMGKSCIRFKNMNQIPYELIAELCQKITVDMWIEKYESSRKK